jgi:malonyl-CoA O-methyltransferase
MRLSYEFLPATGGGAQQSLVLLHGWGSNREVWRPLLCALRNWADITLLDLPGCAPGDEPGSAPALSSLLEGIFDCSPQQAVYVGWSLGGQLAMALALIAPQRVTAVVTICSNPAFIATQDWPGMDREVFGEFRTRARENPTAALGRFDALQVTGASRPRQLLRDLQRLGRSPAASQLLAGLDWLETLDHRESLRSVPSPQLHLLAEADALVPVSVARCIEARLTNVSSAEVRLLPNTSHLAPLEAPWEIAGEVRSFLGESGLLLAAADELPALQKKDVAASFTRAAATYDTVAHLQREVGEQLLMRLDKSEPVPARVLDLGCGTGHFRPALRQRYPQAQYVGLDIAAGMVDRARNHCRDESIWLVADAEAMPLASESIDLVFSSLAVQWCLRPEQVFAELARILKPGGKCVFTTLGPKTLWELRESWAAVDTYQHVNTFLPASGLQRAASRTPGITLHLESQLMRLDYAGVRELLDELKGLGAHNLNRGRPAGLGSRRALLGMLQSYERHRSQGVLPATYEVIYGAMEKS